MTDDDFVDFVDLEEWQRKAIVELEQQAYMEGVDECIRMWKQQKEGTMNGK